MENLKKMAVFVLTATALFFVTTQALECKYRHIQMQSCVDVDVDLNRMTDSTYRGEMCSLLRPVGRCLKENKMECPDNRVFQGERGQVADRFRKYLRTACMGKQDDKPLTRLGRCEIQDKSDFISQLNDCHIPMMMNHRDDQMCEPMRDVFACMKRLGQRNTGCAWQSRSLRKQIALGYQYWALLRSIQYNCEE